MSTRRFLSAAGLAALLALALVAAQSARADNASGALRGALYAVRQLSDPSFAQVVSWARAGAPSVAPFPTRDYEAAELQIQNLGTDDRNAAMSWFNGNGRGALYSRGATDKQIGSRDPSSVPSATATPGAWRDLKLATATLNSGTPPSKIVVINGFVAAKRDGKSAMACVSFKNVANAAATRVVFEFPLLDSNGQQLGVITLDRHGMFSPNIDINTYDSFSDWVNGRGVNAGYADNCATVDNGVAALPILTARFASYRITHVEYADGTNWAPAPPMP